MDLPKYGLLKDLAKNHRQQLPKQEERNGKVGKLIADNMIQMDGFGICVGEGIILKKMLREAFWDRETTISTQDCFSPKIYHKNLLVGDFSFL